MGARMLVVGLLLFPALLLFRRGRLAASMVTDLFGQKQAGIHYGFVSLGMSAGSLLFRLRAKWLGLQTARHWVAAAAALLGFFLLRILAADAGGKQSAVASKRNSD